MPKTRLLLLCGGESAEHAVSLSSARSVLQAVGDEFEVTPLVIDAGGRLLDPAASTLALAAGDAPVGSGAAGLTELGSGSLHHDVVFPLLHGPNGEDGSIQGLLRLAGLPFVGTDILGSAVGMDKLMMKAVLKAAGMPQVGFRAVFRHDWHSDPQAVLDRLAQESFPLFVKPANLGSSLGISKVSEPAGLAAALDLAFGLDRRVIVEQGLENVRELEIAILGNDEPEASPVGEISFQSEFYSYETKYQAGLAELHIPADIPGHLAECCRELALGAFRELDLAGLARVDFFLTEAGELLLNEVNTMPGFTETSMYPRLWQAAGLSYPDLIRRLVELAQERNEPKRRAGISSRWGQGSAADHKPS